MKKEPKGLRWKVNQKKKKQEDGLMGIKYFSFFFSLVLLFFFSLTCFLGDNRLLAKVVMVVRNLSK